MKKSGHAVQVYFHMMDEGFVPFCNSHVSHDIIISYQGDIYVIVITYTGDVMPTHPRCIDCLPSERQHIRVT